MREIDFIMEEMGLAMTINQNLNLLMRFPFNAIPSAIKVDTFAKGKVELLKFKIPKGSILDSMPIMLMNTSLKTQVLVCSVERGSQVFIPSGPFILRADDTISFIATPKNAIKFFHKVAISFNHIKNVMLIGGSTIAIYLTQLLTSMDVNVKL